MSKPRMCEVLGVDIEEKFRIQCESSDFYYVDAGGVVRDADGVPAPSEAVRIINRPRLIKRWPFFTDDELAVLRLMKRAGVGTLRAEDNLRIFARPTIEGWGAVPTWLLPALKVGELVNLDEMELDE